MAQIRLKARKLLLTKTTTIPKCSHDACLPDGQSSSNSAVLEHPRAPHDLDNKIASFPLSQHPEPAANVWQPSEVATHLPRCSLR